jgi:hypothetical protein
VSLEWQCGRDATMHDVYFGSDAAGVAEATTATAGVYRGRQHPNDYTAASLELGRTYYWRIDEVNDLHPESPWVGRVWSFAVADYLLVDDFEDYNDCTPDRIFEHWLDGFGYGMPPRGGGPYYPGNGTGSVVGYDGPPFGERTIVHGGGQSMPYFYDNDLPDGAKYSEATLRVGEGCDWTAYGVEALSIWFCGEANSEAEPMYVAIADDNGGTGVVTHPDPNAALTDTWTEWNIALTEFSNQGVVLSNVDKIAIGFGDRDNPAAGGAGKVIFDDMRLYRGRCLPSLARPAGDFSNNCVVDYADLEIMADNWLISGNWEVTPASPSWMGMVGCWRFEWNMLDSIGGHHGDPCGTRVDYARGVAGQSLSLDGTAYVHFGSVGIDSNDARTIAGWVKASGPAASVDGWTNCFGFTGASGVNRHFDIQRGGEQDFYCIHVYGWEGNLAAVDGQWHHLAATYDGVTIKGYSDGHLAVSEERALDTIDNVQMGKRGDNDSRFRGLIDEVRIYNRVLWQEEIGGLSGKTATYRQDLYRLLTPQDPAIDMNGDGRIDFADYALLADTWLEVVLWP